MAYQTKDLFEKAKNAIQVKKLFFIEDIIPYLPCRKSTFYEHFPVDSDLYKELKDLLDENKMELKIGMRKKWYSSDNATLQLALYRLTGTEEERKKLNQQYVDHTTDKRPINKVTLSDKDKQDLLDNLIPESEK